MKKKIANPSAIYAKCPECGSSQLLHLAVDVLCCSCDWMSTEGFVEAGGMDNLLAAFNDHFRVSHAKKEQRTAADDYAKTNFDQKEHSA